FEVRVRPHPGENLHEYRSACDDSPLEFADPTLPFSDDVRWAHVVVGYTSTSIFEVSAAHRPFLALRRIAKPPAVTPREGLELLYEVCTRDELINALESRETLRAAQLRMLRAASYFIGNISGEYDTCRAVGAALSHGHARSRHPSAPG